MKKNISRNPLWPDWYNGKKIDEVQFGRAFLEQWPLKCVNGTLYTLDGPVEDESEIKQRILENIEEYVTSGLSKKVTNILETIKLLAFSDPFPIEQDCIHLQNGVYHLPDRSLHQDLRRKRKAEREEQDALCLAGQSEGRERLEASGGCQAAAGLRSRPENAGQHPAGGHSIL